MLLINHCDLSAIHLLLGKEFLRSADEVRDASLQLPLHQAVILVELTQCHVALLHAVDA